MQEIEIRKNELVEKIRENMSSHKETYETAVEKFKEKQQALLEDMLEKARKGENFDRLALSRLPVPEDHTDDYKMALEMLEYETRDIIPLEVHDFRKYVRDEWEWRHAWAANTQSYIGG